MKSLEVVKSLKDIDRQISEAELIVRQLQSLLKRNVIPSCYDGLYHVALSGFNRQLPLSHNIKRFAAFPPLRKADSKQGKRWVVTRNLPRRIRIESPVTTPVFTVSGAPEPQFCRDCL